MGEKWGGRKVAEGRFFQTLKQKGSHCVLIKVHKGAHCTCQAKKVVEAVSHHE